MQELPVQQQKPPPEPLFETYEARRESARSLLGFSLIYLSGYFTDPPATFHPQLVHALEDAELKRLLIIGFRGSGKSTFGSLALPLWAALEHPDKFPFIILVSDSTRHATLNISAIKYELENNLLIKQDYGEIKGNVIEDFSLQGDGEEWQKQNIVLSNRVRILARSRGQKVRGLRHLRYRPKLVIVDDPEDDLYADEEHWTSVQSWRAHEHASLMPDKPDDHSLLPRAIRNRSLTACLNFWRDVQCRFASHVVFDHLLSYANRRLEAKEQHHCSNQPAQRLEGLVLSTTKDVVTLWAQDFGPLVSAVRKSAYGKNDSAGHSVSHHSCQSIMHGLLAGQHNVPDECAELLPRTMRVQVSLRFQV